MPRKNSPKNVDPRVRRTRGLLRDALVSQMLEKDYASISIRDITQRAEVAYITFFRHFESIDQLLMEVLDEGMADLIVHIESLAQKSESSALETEGKLIFEFIQQRSDLFRVLFKSQSVRRIRKRVVRKIVIIFQRSCMPLVRSNNTTVVAILSNHIATSLLSLIEWWLDNKMTPPPAQMGKIYKYLIIDSTVGTMSTLSTLPT
jgi:AcrR family transcriptional regulator